jgi:hypothetical protein
MGRSAKADYQAVLESTLATHPDGLPLDELLERSGLKVDRSTLFRHLTRLIETGRAERIGDARASRYRLLGAAPVRAPLAPPDTQRAEPKSVPVEAMEYDAVVKKAVRRIVREWKQCNPVNLQIYLSLLVEPKHLNKVTAAVEEELAGLHEGNLARFGLSQAEFSAFIPPADREAAGE